MLTLGIESSAHTFGVGIVDNGKILANVKRMYSIGTRGIIPAKAAEFHAKNAAGVITAAIQEAGIQVKDLEGVGYTKGPGIGPCLQVGQLAAKMLASKLKIKIVPVHHGIAHLEITKHFCGFRDPVFLYVSGGNSQILALQKSKPPHYSVIGETLDVGVGNMLDSFARGIGLRPAWGSTVAKTALHGRYVRMPYTVKGVDFAFTGLLTHALKLSGSVRKEDLCYSIQETAFSVLCEATERVLLLSNKKELCVCGGVAQSKRLKEMLSKMCYDHKIRFGYVKDEYNADNGAMIALTAEKLLKGGYQVPLDRCDILQRYRIENAVTLQG